MAFFFKSGKFIGEAKKENKLSADKTIHCVHKAPWETELKHNRGNIPGGNHNTKPHVSLCFPEIDFFFTDQYEIAPVILKERLLVTKKGKIHIFKMVAMHFKLPRYYTNHTKRQKCCSPFLHNACQS